MSERVFVPPRPPRRWGLRALGAALVLAVAAPAAVWSVDRAEHCGEGVRAVDGGECVGVTDGAFAFEAAKGLSGKIRAENERVARSGLPSVSVAYVEAMSGGSADRGAETTRQALTGAYLAQRALNGERGTLPKVRLLLASTGSGDRHWKPVVDQLRSMKERERLVAVAGLGQSNDRTKSAVRRLREYGLPMVGATVAADGLRSSEAGFYRVSFPNSDQAAAAARHIAEQQRKHPGRRVQVVRDGNEEDAYNTSLYRDFRSAARREGLKVDDQVVPYRSDEDAVSPSGNALTLAADRVCDGSPPDFVFFAGRGRDLRRFIEAAGEGGRRCRTTVVSGSSTLGVYFDLKDGKPGAALEKLRSRWAHSGLRVYYTAYTHPEIAEKVYGKGGGPFADFEKAYRREAGGPVSALDSGQAMLGHDATLTIGKAARTAVRVYGTRAVTPRMVLAMLEQTNGKLRVRGVSGEIAFDPDTGEPVGRPLALVELNRPPGGGSAGKYRFEAAITP
ncbi:ABC-type branched-chain amino acid transport system, substrate-binding protein [Streptomyces sp. WMMB 714]|uniref:ABC transporter substrate-binding protein n=1 Tax=Streptomyces sp. WMMB 714 TaxID=1286822 RepID=UPI0006985C59|nr:ABC transporter substrate-binding protein [Streptomyces sp. WMMB 714]SCK22244.1 ABC-type branched-chain amino acid transport system, substrate-binding protein [Streptomyces sp. WMMB 714]